MAFTGTPTVTALGINTYKITGVSLAAAANGTITNFGGGGGAVLPSGAPTIDANTKVDVVATATGSTDILASKSGATITITNDDGAAATGLLEIWVQRIQSIVA